MTISASIALTPSSLSAATPYTSSTNVLGGGMKFDIAITVTNTNATDVQVTAIQCFAGITDPIEIGQFPVFPGSANNVAASGGTNVFHANAILLNPSWASSGFPQSLSSYTATIGATVYTSDGTATSASTATFALTAPAAP